MLQHPNSRRIVRRNLEISSALASLPSLLQKIYAFRGIMDPSEIDLSLDRLPDPSLLKGLDELCERLIEARKDDHKITIVGDYDADGATATALALLGLKALGFRHLEYLVPNRFVSGYGLSLPLVDAAFKGGSKVLLTVDNGMSSHEAIRAARNLGLKVLVTDHHLPGSTLPDADAIVNPNLPNDPFPGKGLAGVGVLFYVLLGLRRKLRIAGAFVGGQTPEPNLSEFLDLVALGTIADVVPLDRINRILVQQGLNRIRAGKGHCGILALIEASEKDPSSLEARDLGFSVAPRLNAAGRLEDMALGIECLIAQDLEKARPMAQRLSALNLERRSIEQEMREQALEQLEFLIEREAKHPIPCLFHEDWHQGVIGILASRIKDALDRPVIAFAPNDQDPSEIKGSARSVPGVHMRDLLADIASQYPGLMTRFGGHAMAAGLTLDKCALGTFRKALEETALKWQISDLSEPVLYTDGPLDVEAFSPLTATLIAKAGPWGQNFPEPLFDGNFELIAPRIVGERHLKMSLQPEGSHELIDAIAFQVENPEKWLRCTLIRAAYRLDLNTFRGRTRLQLKIEHMASV